MLKKFLSAVLAAVMVFSVSVSVFAEDGPESKLDVYFLDVGKGDAAVVTCGGHSMMIDGGKADKSDYIYSFLRSKSLKRLDYVVCTHTDSDHCGGLAGALNYADVGIAFCTDTEGDKQPFQNFVRYLEAQNNAIVVPNPGDTFTLGDARVSILAPEKGVKLSDNTSIVLRITYGETSFLFTGDAEQEDEAALLKTGYDLESTVLKVAHHGSKSSCSQAFLRAVSPRYAVISVGDNTSGHPTEKVLKSLKNQGCQLFRTDMQGIIHFESDGRNLSVDVEKNAQIDTFSKAGAYIEEDNPVNILDTPESGEPEIIASADRAVSGSSVSEEPVERKTTDYVANTNSKKFHYPYCSSVDSMKEKNKMYYNGTRDELISMGYRPCKKCNP